MKFLCKFLPHWFREELNWKYPRWDDHFSVNTLPAEQGRYIRTCRNCGEEQIIRMDCMNHWWWQSVEEYLAKQRYEIDKYQAPLREEEC